ncbi:MAG: DUF1835 domain-containing protein [Ruminococcaceae bacterium]|nr:DUF1835 domain-containing protein [Oscillospiraceae bacterium]
MIEVLFGENESGAMKYALKQGFILSRDVVCLAFMANIGDISKPLTGEYRRRLIARMLYRKQWGKDVEMKRELKQLGAIYSEQLERLFAYLKSGEPIRIWHCSAPYSMCGLLWLCSLLENYDSDVYSVEMPRVVAVGNNAHCYSSWGEFTPESFADFLPLQRKIPRAEIRKNAFDWKRLQSENAPLRAVVNGVVISAPANFYDFLIRKYLTEEPIREAVLIGRILGENPLGIGDWWYALRIDKLIKAGKIEVVFDSDIKYERVLRLKR